MKARFVGFLLLVVCVLGLFAGPHEACALVDVYVTQLDDPWPGLESYVITAVSDGPPIEAFESLQVGGPAHQVHYLGQPSVFVNSLPPTPPLLRSCDTHLLFAESQCLILGDPPIEINDGSNPLGLPYGGAFSIGVGAFLQPMGSVMGILLPYQSSELDLLQVVVPYGGVAQIVGGIYAGGELWYFASYVGVISPSGQVVVSPSAINFGPTRVGTTATAGTNAWIEADGFLEDVPGSYGASGAPFGPSDQGCWLSTGDPAWLNFTFSPTSRGTVSGSGNVEAEGDIAPASLTLSGKGVGPVFGAEQAPGTTIELGDFPVDSFFDVFFELGNLTSDPELGDLTILTIDAAIESDAAGAFEILGAAGFSLSVGETDEIQLRFDAAGLTPGEYEAQLVLRTDVGAAAGATSQGQAYSFTLHAWANIPGDANRDGEVNDQDASILGANWLRTGDAAWTDGDFNRDRNVDDRDAAILAAHWGHGAPEQVPEPSTLVGMLALGIFVACRRKLR